MQYSKIGNINFTDCIIESNQLYWHSCMYIKHRITVLHNGLFSKSGRDWTHRTTGYWMGGRKTSLDSLFSPFIRLCIGHTLLLGRHRGARSTERQAFILGCRLRTAFQHEQGSRWAPLLYWRHGFNACDMVKYSQCRERAASRLLSNTRYGNWCTVDVQGIRALTVWIEIV